MTPLVDPCAGWSPDLCAAIPAVYGQRSGTRCTVFNVPCLETVGAPTV
jgi:hypothetical protein